MSPPLPTRFASVSNMRSAKVGEFVEQYEDQGISGAALGNRPGVLRLQETAFARRLDVILVTDLSRLSRSQGDLSKLIDRLVTKERTRHWCAGWL